jgi:hypothetical protein
LKPVDVPKGYLAKAVSGGNTLLKILEKVGKSDELKNAGAKKLNKYLICLCKQWTAIFKILDGMAGGKTTKTKKKTMIRRKRRRNQERKMRKRRSRMKMRMMTNKPG